MGNVSKNLFEHSPSEIIIPSIVIYELEVGISKSISPQKRMQQLQMLIDQVNIINFTSKEAKDAAIIRASLEEKGLPIGPIDTLIAGCARANNYTLVTRNTKEFQRVSNLRIENWY
jgi:tRNA(fMet)-specific endonuclease VapC